jgi:serine/threonine-protein kinase
VDATLQDPLVGRLVDGRYHVESRIAQGGMATVYVALDRRLDRDVALKVMHQELTGDDDFVSRFIREARAAARLSHPNVVQVYDQGEDDGLLYLAMEYLPGRTLRESLTERGALTIRETLRVLEPVLDALAAAHRAGIVHGDVKPENVVLTDDGRAKVADFGLARAGAATLNTAAPGRLLGTAAYLAPELLTRGIADARADVYAVGILLYEMLTGRQPFTGDDALQVARRHVVEAVPPPSMLVGHVPVELDDLVTAATATDPDQRPANAEQMLAITRRPDRWCLKPSSTSAPPCRAAPPTA